MKDKTKRVLYISYNGLSEPLAHSQVIPYLKGLNRKGFDFILLTFEKQDRLKSVGREKSLLWQQELKKEGIDWKWLMYHKKPSLLATLADITAGVFYGIYLFRKYGIVLVHARGTVSAAMAYMISKFCRIPFLFDLRGLLAEEYADIGRWSRRSITYRLVKRWEKVFLNSADYVIVLTEWIKQFLLTDNCLNRLTETRIKVIPCCIDTDKFIPNIKDSNLINNLKLNDKFIFIYIGSLGTWYMLDEMLDFFGVAKHIKHNAHFLILTTSNFEDIEEHISNKQLNRSDFTIMEVEPSQVARYACLADVGVTFIKPLFSKQASSPTKLGEYLACGLPVVINSGIGDGQEWISTNKLGVIVKNFERDAYKNYFRELLDLMEFKDLLSIRCRKAACDFFSLDQGIGKYCDAYRETIK